MPKEKPPIDPTLFKTEQKVGMLTAIIEAQHFLLGKLLERLDSEDEQKALADAYNNALAEGLKAHRDITEETYHGFVPKTDSTYTLYKLPFHDEIPD